MRGRLDGNRRHKPAARAPWLRWTRKICRFCPLFGCLSLLSLQASSLKSHSGMQLLAADRVFLSVIKPLGDPRA
ncbi:hypothetical protein COU39_03375 [Candidatus Micrarchaeota archaeon CG10_big_fil_rev_8_21_14_0_10_60_32]|nr:MAG: hypothetical protein AUJ16_03645 [Candidatus Micrarchaeota archaeon CG1_02_60_51]PIN95935.1 MAG: hypothetical protein COU39_03375 [Candidatus Micrarchaeota archaeon CG10_big_fil_rev_8_21_14_0_10_60_32]PIO01840.1 MAG: hypothetical protein COT58_03065 [Candidatus Micrarchaeota archaeon CG09_land_8_20_14_0_10_60_16]